VHLTPPQGLSHTPPRVLNRNGDGDHLNRDRDGDHNSVRRRSRGHCDFDPDHDADRITTSTCILKLVCERDHDRDCDHVHDSDCDHDFDLDRDSHHTHDSDRDHDCTCMLKFISHL
jgi:hypothetical protein